MNGKAFQVARWEYIEKIKSKAFLISLFLMPMIMLGMGILPGILASRADTESKDIGIIDQSDEVIQPLSKVMEERFKLPNGEPNYMFRSITAGGDFAKAKMIADSLVVSNQIEGYLVIRKEYMNDTTLEYRSENVGNFRVIERLTRAIRDIVVERKLLSRGLSPALAKEQIGRR